MTFFNLRNKWFIWPLFLLLMTYAVLRAWFVEPMLDELTTYYWYIQTGLLPGHGAKMDANNHILNSFVSNQLYKLVGDYFFAFRVFALSGFVIYFYAARRLILGLKPSFPVLVFISLLSIHWIFDYFSLSRGYGPAIAFFMLILYFIREWNESSKTKHFVFILLSSAFLLLSNLSYFIPVLLMFGYLVIGLIFRRKNFQLKQKVTLLISISIFLSFLVPAYIYIQKLKALGMLWWGSVDGLWETTGRTLSITVFFSQSPVIKYVLGALLILMVVMFFINWKKQGLKAFLFQPEFWIPGLLLMCLLSFFLMATILKVNYPEDRVGMYLVPLFLLSFVVTVRNHNYLKWLSLSLLWFPLSFAWKMNLHTTVFSPGDIMTKEFYDAAIKDLKPGETVSISQIVESNYAFSERKNQRPVKHIAMLQKSFTPQSDLIIAKTSELSRFDFLNTYKVIAEDRTTSYIALRRKKAYQRTALFSSTGNNQQSNAEFISFYKGPIKPEWKNKTIQINVQADLKIPGELNELVLVVSSNDNQRYDDLNILRYYSKKNLLFHLNYPYPAKQFAEGESELSVYIWNPERKVIQLTHPMIQIIELK